MSRAYGICAALAVLPLGACAQITAADADLPAPDQSVALTATAVNGAFSRIPGNVTVQSATLRHFAAAAPAPAFVLIVTWSADAVALFGGHSIVQQTAAYSFHGHVGK